ncbi:MAG: ABC transporter permease [Bacilli bacterium]|nr:ABC transporter permease [Bacilli bacterium]
MNLLNKLTKKNLLLNKKRTIVTVIGIILSVALISALSSLVVSFQSSMIKYEKINTGNFHISFTGLDESDRQKYRENRQIDDVFFTKEIGYAKLPEIKNEDKPFVYVTAYDFDALENLGITLKEGRLPKTSKEVVIPRHLKTNGRVDLKVGDSIKLNIGKRLTLDGYELFQSNPFTFDEEKFEPSTELEYKIVGIIERPSYKIEDYSSPGYTFITCLDTNETGKYNAYVRFKKDGLKDFYRNTANILGVDEELYEYINTFHSYNSEEEYNDYMKKNEKLSEQMKNSKYGILSSNKTLIALEGGANDDPSIRVLFTVAAIVSIIIIVTSVFCIKNSFNISITEKTKQYGMLASVGATKKQIKKNVLYEAFVLGLIGIPLGVLSGLLAAYILILVCDYFLAESLNLNLVFSISFISLAVSVILGILTIYLSTIRSARKASRISPITAIRNNDDIKIKSKKLKSPKMVKKIFGIGGDVSYKNLKRNNKKYRTTVVSIIVCVSVFIALYSFMNLAFKTVEMQYGEQNYNLEITANIKNKEASDNAKEQLLKLEGYNRYSVLRDITFTIDNPKFTDEYYNQLRELDYDEKSNTMSSSIYSIGEEEYKAFIKKIGLNYNDVVDKAILINNDIDWISTDGESTVKKTEIPFFTYKAGDILKGRIYPGDSSGRKEINYEIAIAAVTYERPLGLENYYGTPLLIVSDSKLNENLEDNSFSIVADIENPDKNQDEADKILSSVGDSNYHIFNLDKEVRTMNSLFTLIAIFLYGFITVIALIGITNIFNTITTNMELRSREFAMLKSIGMTKKEFNRMVSLESLFYGTKSLIIGIPIGCLLSYLIYKALMDGYWSYAYTLPYAAIIMSILAVYILVTCIMKYSIKKINRQNTIETIRNDNI